MQAAMRLAMLVVKLSSRSNRVSSSQHLLQTMGQRSFGGGGIPNSSRRQRAPERLWVVAAGIDAQVGGPQVGIPVPVWLPLQPAGACGVVPACQGPRGESKHKARL